eukprot:1908244-Pleurochrysis_carterae.AAC.1
MFVRVRAHGENVRTNVWWCPSFFGLRVCIQLLRVKRTVSSWPKSTWGVAGALRLQPAQKRARTSCKARENVWEDQLEGLDLQQDRTDLEHSRKRAKGRADKSQPVLSTTASPGAASVRRLTCGKDAFITWWPISQHGSSSRKG